MLRALSKQNAIIFITIIISCIFFTCKKNDSTPAPPVNPPDLGAQVNFSVSGFVVDENNKAVKNATVKVGTLTVSTDSIGFFEANNATAPEKAAVVSIDKEGYFKTSKTFIVKTGQPAFCRVKLITKKNIGSINSASGGNVATTDGLQITLPANAVVNAATKSAYTGAVSISGFWINPSSTEVNGLMPGDLRGINTSGELKGLATFGMAAVQLTGSGGELLQVAEGKKATLNFPIPASMQANAPASIPLWYFDDATGLWKEQGTATKTGNQYIGEVSHFSFWNCDIPANYVQFNCTVVAPNGSPIQNAIVSITSTGFGTTYGYTNSNGYVSGVIPANEQLELKVYNYLSCPVVHSQSFSSANTDVSLSNIVINNSTSTAVVNGNIINCTAHQVTNGHVIMIKNDIYYKYPADDNGAFNFSTLICGNSSPVVFFAEDKNTMQQGNPTEFTLAGGNNNIGTIQACGTTIEEFFDYTIDGVSYSSTYVIDTVFYSEDTSINIIASVPNQEYVNFIMMKNGIGLNSTQRLEYFYNSIPRVNYSYYSNVPDPAITITITEYGDKGQFFSGHLSGTLKDYQTQTPHNIALSFRVRRNH